MSACCTVNTCSVHSQAPIITRGCTFIYFHLLLPLPVHVFPAFCIGCFFFSVGGTPISSFSRDGYSCFFSCVYSLWCLLPLFALDVTVLTAARWIMYLGLVWDFPFRNGPTHALGRASHGRLVTLTDAARGRSLAPPFCFCFVFFSKHYRFLLRLRLELRCFLRSHNQHSGIGVRLFGACGNAHRCRSASWLSPRFFSKGCLPLLLSSVFLYPPLSAYPQQDWWTLLPLSASLLW